MKHVVLLPQARDDVSSAYDWYERQRPGLGEDYLGCVKAALASVQRRPDSFASIDARARRALVRRFPYAIFFVVEAERVVVLGVLHTRRDPAGWKNRR